MSVPPNFSIRKIPPRIQRRAAPVKGTARPYRCITHIEVEYACSRRYSDIMARFKALNLKPSHIRNTP